MSGVDDIDSHRPSSWKAGEPSKPPRKRGRPRKIQAAPAPVVEDAAYEADNGEDYWFTGKGKAASSARLRKDMNNVNKRKRDLEEDLYQDELDLIVVKKTAASTKPSRSPTGGVFLASKSSKLNIKEGAREKVKSVEHALAPTSRKLRRLS